VFTREAVMLIHAHSGGIPRTISVICDNALVNGFAAGRKPVDREMVLEVCRDFRLRAAAEAAGAPEAEPVEALVVTPVVTPVAVPEQPAETREPVEPMAGPARSVFGFGRR
jgi:hypothetical protein